MMNVIKPMYSYFAEFKIKMLSDEASILGNFNEERQIFLKQIFEHTQFKKIWGTLNFDSLYQAYGSDRNRVIAALEYLDENGLIQLETKGMTEVYQVNLDQINQPELANILSKYFFQKEVSEIQRIAAMVRFFELDSCLSWNLARYFDDQMAPKQCGHCSVCRGQVAKLGYSQPSTWPSEEFLIRNIQSMQADLMDKKGLQKTDISPSLITRFLTGISVPVFARTDLRKMEGFASCEHLRYQAVLDKVKTLRSSL
jgi:ATP-dependent DNA helicase RecQ